MRTTFDLPDDLYRALKIRSAQQGIPMRDLVQELLQRGLMAPVSSVERQSKLRPKFPTLSTGGSYPSGLSSNAELFELLGKAP